MELLSKRVGLLQLAIEVVVRYAPADSGRALGIGSPEGESNGQVSIHIGSKQDRFRGR